MGRNFRQRYWLGGQGAAVRAYSWPTRKDLFFWETESKFTPYTYILQQFPAYSPTRECKDCGLSKHVNLLVHRMCAAVLNKRKEFDEEWVQKIIQGFEQEIQVDAVTKKNLVKTALFHIAFGIGVPQMVKLFYKMKFEAFYDHEGLFGIHKAIKEGHTECCRLVLQLDNRNANLISRVGETPLSVACDTDTPHDMIRLLIEYGADPNLRGDNACDDDSARDLPLLLAVSKGNEDLVTLLLESGADFNVTTLKGETALHIAARYGETAMLARFLELGVSLYAVDKDGCSCLVDAVEWNFLPTVHQILQTASSDGRVLELVNEISLRLESVLMLAAVNSNLEILQELSVYGANYDYVNPEGKSALSVALDFLEKGRSFGIGVGRRTHDPSTEERLAWLRSLLLGTSREVIAQNMEMLMYLVARGNICDLFHYVLEAEVSLETRLRFKFVFWTHHGTTMLLEATRHRHKEIVDLLLTAGAKMIYPDSPQLSPFPNALWLSVTMIECFLKHNVELNFIRKKSSHNVPEVLTSILKFRKDSLFLNVLQLLLRCGLDPSSNYWCSCRSGVSNARLRKRPKTHVLLDGLKDMELENYNEMIKMLLEFSPVVTPCLCEILNTIDYTPVVPSLQHLCRLSYRKLFSPSQLLHEKWMETSNLPNKIKLYLSFDNPLQ